MSGWMKNRRTYQLTTAKAQHWHSSCGCGQSWVTHLAPNGFEIVGPYNEIAGPGLAEGVTDRLFEAISGRRSFGGVGARND
jgi:hypothetical protein